MAQEIHHHTFKPVDAPANPVISSAFTIGIIVLFAALLFGLMKTINCKNLQIRFLSLFAIVGVAATLTFIGYFWFALTLMEAVGIFFILAPITCLLAFIGGKLE